MLNDPQVKFHKSGKICRKNIEYLRKHPECYGFIKHNAAFGSGSGRGDGQGIGAILSGNQIQTNGSYIVYPSFGINSYTLSVTNGTTTATSTIEVYRDTP